MITGDQIRQARKLLGWHRGQIAIRARGMTGNTVGKAEGVFPGTPPSRDSLMVEDADMPLIDKGPGLFRLFRWRKSTADKGVHLSVYFCR